MSPPKPLTDVFPREDAPRKRKPVEEKPSETETYSEHLKAPVIVLDRCPHTTKVMSRAGCSLCLNAIAAPVAPGPIIPLDEDNVE